MAKIIIDIGHADKTGARSLDGKYEEHNLCTGIGALIIAKLTRMGHEVVRLDFPHLNNRDDLNKTISEANKISGVKLGVSLHMDAADSASAKGAHICYLTASGKAAASHIIPELTKLLPGRAEHMVKRTNLAVLKQTKAPWILIECGFITNPHDCDIAVNHTGDLAEIIAKGIDAAVNA